MIFTLLRAQASVQLGQELGRGGEGTVFAIDGQQNRVAKVYSTIPDASKRQKLSAMVFGSNQDLLRIAAWPIDLLMDNSGAMRGYIMPRVLSRRDIHELYTPKSRSEAFPDADFRFLVHVGANVARAFAVVHEHRYVIGDVNHGSLLVGHDGTVMLVDCDSYQIRTNGRTFTCDVGTPLFIAPEIQGHSLRGLERTVNHDLFGLAILLFQMLFMGRHPFAGKYLGRGEMPPERAIAEYRFVYGPEHDRMNMEPPPHTVPLETMGATVARLFSDAFSRLGSTSERPTARDWVDALEGMKASLRVCPTANWHQYPGGLMACPWCSLEAQTGVRLFGLRITTYSPGGAVDLGELWQAVISIPGPESDPMLPSSRPWQAPAGVKLPSKALKNVRKILSVTFGCMGMVSCSLLPMQNEVLWVVVAYVLALGIAFAVWPRLSAKERETTKATYSAAQGQWAKALACWQREASKVIFDQKLSELQKARAELADMPKIRERRLAKLEAERETRQKEYYLDRFRIDRARIAGIGVARIAMLISYGIETAADIDSAKIRQIPGFGDTLTDKLVLWRHGHERNFRFNPKEPVLRQDIEAVDRELSSRRMILISALKSGPDTLNSLCQNIIAARIRLAPVLEKQWTAFMIAKAHYDVL
jgi:DNA-binding helix-hairpin-helix protein with protein kinase domain